MIESKALTHYLSGRIKTLFRNRYRRLKRHNVYLDGLCLSKRPRLGNDPIHLNIFDRPKRDDESSEAMIHFWYRGPGWVVHSGSVILDDHEVVVRVDNVTHRVDLSDPNCFEAFVEIFSGYFAHPV